MSPPDGAQVARHRSRPQRHASAPRLGRTLVVVATSMALVVAPPAAWPGGVAYAQAASVEGAVQRLDALIDEAERVNASLDRSYLDVDALGLELFSEDLDTIVAWVHEHVAYQPYEGMLRGDTGTLLARAGNSLDQALLTARLLTDAGYETRIAVAPTDDAWREALLARTRMPPPERAPSFDATGRLAETLGFDAASVTDMSGRVAATYAALADTFRNASGHLMETLESAAGIFGADAAATVDAENAYAWVQVRNGPEGEWRSAHPVFADAPNGLQDLVPQDTFVDEVPVGRQHRLRFRALVEQRRGATLESKSLMDAWERPVADLVGDVLSYTTYPEELAELAGSDAEVAAAFAGSSAFLPVFNDALPEGSQRFDRSGVTSPAELAATAAPDLFQSDGGILGGALGVIAEEEEDVALSAYWLEFTLIEPGGRERTYRRTVFDRIGPANRDAGIVAFREGDDADEAYAAMQTTHTFMVDAGGSYPAAYAHLRTSGALVASRGYLESVIRTAAGDRVDDLDPPRELVDAIRRQAHLRQFLLFDVPVVDDDAVSFRPSPALTMISRTWDGATTITDVLQNERTSVAIGEDGSLAMAPRATVARGVWESVAEGAIAAPGDEVFDTARGMAAAREQGIATTLIQPGDTDRIASLALPAEALAAIAADVEHGYVVLTPTALPEGMRHATWWRVQPRTGVTLGRGMDGRGAAQVDHATAVSIITGALFGWIGLMSCGAGGGGACCLVDGIGYFLLGYLAAFMLASYITIFAAAGAEAAAQISLATGLGVDIVGAAAGVTGMLPSACSSGSLLPSDDGRRMAGVTDRGPACDLRPPFEMRLAIRL